jgi:hypothetical protein
MKVTFEELAAKYPIQDIAPYGACLIVPGAEFDPDWEVSLGDLGYACHMTDYDGKPVTLVQKKKAAVEGKVVYVPPVKKPEAQTERAERTEALQGRKQGGNMWKHIWTREEDGLLIELWNKTPRIIVAEITKAFTAKFPERSFMAVTNRVTALQLEGRIQPRFRTKKQKSKEAKRTPEKPSPEPKATKNPFSADAADTALMTVAEIAKLSEAYDALSKRYVELGTELGSLRDFVEANLSVKYKLANLERNLIKHKHAVSGEAMLPMEVQE